MPAHFTLKRRVTFSETDMAGIVHFANYFRLMEEVEHGFFRSVGLSVSMQHEQRHIGWPRVAAKCEYLGPLKFEDEVELSLSVNRIGEKSFSYTVEFFVQHAKIAVGEITSVCCELIDGKMTAIMIPTLFRQKLMAVLTQT